MTRIYYDRTTGFVAERYPHNYPKGEDYVEVEDEEAGKTMSCQTGYLWAVVDGKLKVVEDTDPEVEKERKEMELRNRICDLKQYLNDTDYIISKLNEAKLLDESEFEELKSQYSSQLEKRKETRAQINLLESQL